MMAPLALRGVGLRELGHAAGLLAGREPAAWAWTRVAGDVLDLTLMGRTMRHRHRNPLLAVRSMGRESAACRSRRRRAAIVTGALAGITAVDVLVALRTSRTMGARRRAMSLRAAVTINRPSDEVYRFWRDFGNLPRFMHHLESVRTDGDGRSHWTAKGPAGRSVQWDAEITEEQPNRMIAWRTVDGTKVPNSGRVRFLPLANGRGTEVRVELEYAPPGGGVGKAVAKLFGEEPMQQVKDDLRRFKQVIETGEVVRSDGSPDGITLRQQLMQRPARPVAG
jgi:uncharacterized membrane protein